MLKHQFAGGMVLLLLLVAACQSEPMALPPSAVPSTPVNALASFQAHPTPTAISENVIDAADAEYVLLENIYDRVTPSVVYIDVTINSPQAGVTDQASGSGFIYDDQGHIVTNAHVVNGATDIQVTFHDGYVTPATLVGLDAYSDMAVIKVDNVDKSRLLPVSFGDSDQLHVGERVIAIGNPFGLASSMTDGIVSGLGRQLPSAELVNNSVGGFNNPSIIQVDAQINPGNSGGPLLNSHGEVVGVNTAIRTDTGTFQGVGFAVPSKTVERVIPELIQDGKVQYSWLGISTMPTDGGYTVAGLADQLKLPVTAGVLVTGVTANSPASVAGLRGGDHAVLIRGQSVCAGGDIIVAVNDIYINSMDDLVAYLVSNTKPGDTIKLLVVRGTDTFEVPLTLTARPTDSDAVPPDCGKS
ncbi:MAG TPA: trypsin-like peptidase domain-containing protein [Phototrophicaceae bacterium]|nr:trypsin-like peptidase domain-containing protein [Phototrophicaceae bacterium]